MFYSRKKLSSDESNYLVKISSGDLEPYNLLYSPVYVYLVKNEKFLAVKGPFDFFSDEDLERLKTHDAFYVPKFVQSLNYFRKSAKQIRIVLQSRLTTTLRIQQDPNFKVLTARAPFEISNTILSVLGMLWNKLSNQD